MQLLNVTASKPLYKAWKRAVNESASLLVKEKNFVSKDYVYQYIEQTYGCKTLAVHHNNPVEKTHRHVDLEFPSEKHVTLFLLRWAK